MGLLASCVCQGKEMMTVRQSFAPAGRRLGDSPFATSYSVKHEAQSAE
jgi:hypothetical protein